MSKKVICIIIALFSLLLTSLNIEYAKAYSLEESIEEQITHIDLSGLEEYANSINYDGDIITKLKEMLSGNYEFDYSSFFNYIKSAVFDRVKTLFPTLIYISVIAIVYAIINNLKGESSNTGVLNALFLVCYSAITIIVLSQIMRLGKEIENDIKNLSILCQIMSPIIISLMVASGGSVSASIYTPAVSFLSSGIISFVLSIILPLVNVMLILDVLSGMSPSIKVKKFSDFISSFIKWSLGIIITIFSIFISVQGLVAGVHDGVSVKATKYLISNSVPIVGGLISSGYDLIAAGSVLIKNAVGVGVVILLFFTVLSPVIYIFAFSFILKLAAGFTESIADNRLSEVCTSVAKHTNYLLAMILLTGFMMLIMVVLMTLSANAVF